MQNTPLAYKSTVLAQAALLNNPLKSFESSPINGKIKANSHELQMPNIWLFRISWGCYANTLYPMRSRNNL
jgi:hypothetical protein